MARIYENNGKFTVVIDGFVVGHNLTRKEAKKRVEDYDFD